MKNESIGMLRDNIFILILSNDIQMKMMEFYLAEKDVSNFLETFLSERKLFIDIQVKKMVSYKEVQDEQFLSPNLQY